MSSIARRFTVLFVFTLILSACSVLPGVTVAPGSSETTPLALPTLGQASAGAGVASTPTAPIPTAAPTATPLPSAQPAPTNPPVVEPQPVVSQPTLQPPTTTPLADLNDFSTQLAAALEARDLSTLRSLMGDQFAFAAWNASLTVIDSDDAIQNLSQDRLAPGAQPVVRFGTDLVQLLSGTDPLSLWGPVDQVVRAFHVMGLGPLAADEAVVVIGRSPATGRFYFHGILFPPGGYFTAQPSDMVTGTSVQAVAALDDLNLRTGPGFNYALEGGLRTGEIAIVTGVSLDGAWWRIKCVQDSSGFCWVSADPALTQPTARP